jgi:hypothetical protein
MAYFSPVNWLASTYAPWFLKHLVGFEEAVMTLRKMGRYPDVFVDRDTKAIRDRVENRFVDMLQADQLRRIPRGEEVWKLIDAHPAGRLPNSSDHARYNVCHELWLMADHAAHIAVAEGRLTVAEVEDGYRQFAEEIAAATA